MSEHPELEVLVRWEHLVGELLDRTQRFPKAARFTFAGRIDAAALDVLELLVDARYATGAARAAHLVEVDRRLARLRVLLRLAHARAYLSHGGYEHVSRALDEVGRMVGGWRRREATA